YDQRAVGGQFALTAANGFFYQLGGADIGVHGVVGLRHVVPRRPEAESSKLRSASKNSLQEKSGGIMPEKSAGCEIVSGGFRKAPGCQRRRTTGRRRRRRTGSAGCRTGSRW